uniref:Gamma-glutamyltransferase 5a n=1 Tax=Paramormyrops kingsleyae TaxID=1676925 RepID=A0A3B3TA17_9TELE|nr:glutathione hydrolase 5 proenzyme-like [Paramormyrops kingsleyae]
MASRERVVIGVVVAVLIIIVCIVVARHASKHQCFGNAAVASDSLTCSEIGRDILKQGGSAVDGAIAALLCIYLVNPHSAGLGGGAVFTIMEKTGKVKIVNSRETVPAELKPDLMKDCSKGSQGSQWIGVPGEIRAFEQAHNLYGKLPWAKLFEPAIRLAQDGVPVSAYLAKLLQRDDIKQRVEGSHLCDILCYGNKTVFRQGAVMRFPKLAETFENIANYGANAFYTGRIARDLIQEIKEAGGTLTMEDLRSFQAKVTDAWTVPIDDYVMHFPPPPTGGAILAFLLNIMKGYKLSPSSLEGDQKALTYHRYIEALKFANAQRKKTGDPDFNPGDEAAHLIEEAFADRVRAMISDSRTYNPNYYNVTPSLDRFGTTHVSVLAADGSAVSVTSTINDKFGSGVYSYRTGVILNNEIADFCGIKDNLNTREQPPSSMAPSILYSKAKSRTMVIGASGGTMITTGIAMALMNHLWFGMDLKDAIAAPVLFVRQNTTEEYEQGFDETVLQELKTFGHHSQELATVRNVVNAVVMEGTCIVAQSDARRMAEAAGY